MNEEKPKRDVFEVDDRIIIRLDITLALALSELIFKSNSPNKALHALAYKLKDIEKQLV